jgi:flagellar biosynthesis regulator FlbT
MTKSELKALIKEVVQETKAKTPQTKINFFIKYFLINPLGVK